MLAVPRLTRGFAWKKIFELTSYEKMIKRQRMIELGKVWSGVAISSVLFASEWYTLSTFATMFTAILYIKRSQNPIYQNTILSIETNDEDKAIARVKTLREQHILNINAITPLTDVYPAYRALQDAHSLLKDEQVKIASFNDDKNRTRNNLMKSHMQNLLNDTQGHIVSIKMGSIIPYHEFSDRFHFFFRQNDDLFIIGFPFTPEINFDAEELMRVLSGNKELKPRRSVALAEADEKIAIEQSEKLKARLRGEPLQELPNQNIPELPTGRL